VVLPNSAVEDQNTLLDGVFQDEEIENTLWGVFMLSRIKEGKLP